MKPGIRALIAVVFPFLVMMAWTLRHALVSGTGRVVELKIAGYDPRDLLSGHFLTYRVDYGKMLCGGSALDPDYCVCLDAPESGPATASWNGACEQRPDRECKAMLRGVCESGQFRAGIERFYFGEEHMEKLRIVPKDATILVALDGKGGGVVKAMHVEGEPLEEWLQRAP